MNNANNLKQPGRHVNFSDTTEVTCDKCNHNVFNIGTFMRKVSPILSGTGKTEYIPIEAIYCVKCYHCNDQFVPEELKKQSILAK